MKEVNFTGHIVAAPRKNRLCARILQVLANPGYYYTLHMFNGLFSMTTWTSRYKKGKASLDLNEARDDGVL